MARFFLNFVPSMSPLPWVAFLIAFLTGFITCIVASVGALILFLKRQATRTHPENVKPAMNAMNLNGQDPHLTMAGWIRVSSTLLATQEAVEKFKMPTENPQEDASTWVSTIGTLYESSITYTSFLAHRFMGENAALPQKEPAVVKSQHVDCYGVLRHRTLFFYTDDTRTECRKVVLISDYDITLVPHTLSDHSLFLPHHPILLSLKDPAKADICQPKLYIFAISSLEKENWFIILRRSTMLPAYADAGAMSTFFKDEEPVQRFFGAMKKLEENTSYKEGVDQISTAWLNALLGRWYCIVDLGSLLFMPIQMSSHG
jgi:hypothetical protein